MTNVRTQAHSRRQHGSFEVTNVTLKTVARVCFVLGLISPASSQSSAASSLAAEDVYLKLQKYDNVLEQLNTYIAENPRGEQLQNVMQMRDQLVKAKENGRP